MQVLGDSTDADPFLSLQMRYGNERCICNPGKAKPLTETGTALVDPGAEGEKIMYELPKAGVRAVGQQF